MNEQGSTTAFSKTKPNKTPHVIASRIVRSWFSGSSKYIYQEPRIHYFCLSF